MLLVQIPIQDRYTISTINEINKNIVVSLFKREDELTGIVPLCVYSTYGFPVEEILLIAKDTGLTANLEAFTLLEEEAKERSRKAHQVKEQIASQNIFEEFLEKKSKEEGRIDGGLGKSLDLMGKLNDFLGYR